MMAAIKYPNPLRFSELANTPTRTEQSKTPLVIISSSSMISSLNGGGVAVTIPQEVLAPATVFKAVRHTCALTPPYMVLMVGFEPTLCYNGLQNRSLRPLGHISIIRSRRDGRLPLQQILSLAPTSEKYPSTMHGNAWR
jgi:hypothetical protein